VLGSFDVLITAYKNIYAQQNLAVKPFSIFVVRPTNDGFCSGTPKPRDALADIRPATYVTMGSDGRVSSRTFSARGDSGAER
jgi:hypothetical protein